MMNHFKKCNVLCHCSVKLGGLSFCSPAANLMKDPDILFLTINGLILGLGVIVGITFGTRKLTKRLPLRILFGLTLGLGAYVSIALIGNAIRIFQEVGYISTTPTFAILPQLDINVAIITGIHPTLETITGQLILLSIYITDSIYVLKLRPRKKKAIESSRRSMADFNKDR